MDSGAYHAPNLIDIEQTDKYQREDPPLIDLKVTNPVTYFKLWLKRLLKNEGIDLRVRIRPLTAIALGLAFATFFAGTGFSVAKIFFPNSSPILKREVIYQGTVQKTDTGDYFISLPDSSLYKLRSSKVDFNKYLNRQVLLKGNLGREPNIISVTNVMAFEAPAE